MSETQGGNTIMSFAVSPEQRELIEQAAAKEHRSLSSYIRSVVLPDAERLLKVRQKQAA